MRPLLLFHAFMHMHYCTSFRYARCTRTDVKHTVLELNPKIVSGGHLQKMEGLAGAIEDPAAGRAQGLVNTNTGLVLPQASPGA